MRRAPWLVAAAVLVVLAVSGLLLARRSEVRPAWLGVARARNLLVVTLDTTRADHVGSYGHPGARPRPRLDGLAARGLRFEHAATVTPLTLPAHSSLITGTFPALPRRARQRRLLPRRRERRRSPRSLKARGFARADSSAPSCSTRRWGIAQGFDHYFDDFDLSRFDMPAGLDAVQRPGERGRGRALRWLAAEPTRPFFAVGASLRSAHAPTRRPNRSLAHSRDARGRLRRRDRRRPTRRSAGSLDALERDGRLANDRGRRRRRPRRDRWASTASSTHGFFVYDAAVHIPLDRRRPRRAAPRRSPTRSASST